VTGTDQALADLRARYGARWQVWYVPHALDGSVTWCAHPWSKKDDRRGVLHADKPEHLAEYITEAETQR
jgi:hypothetical protein